MMSVARGWGGGGFRLASWLGNLFGMEMVMKCEGPGC